MKMTLRNQLKNVKIQILEPMKSHFTRVSQMKEQLEEIKGNVEEGDIFITTLNGLPISWDSFIEGIFSSRRLISFSRIQEESQNRKLEL